MLPPGLTGSVQEPGGGNFFLDFFWLLDEGGTTHNTIVTNARSTFNRTAMMAGLKLRGVRHTLVGGVIT